MRKKPTLRFVVDARGFAGAEKALMIAFALAIVVLVAALVQGGSERAGSDARRTLSQGLAQGPTGVGNMHLAARALDTPGAVQAPAAAITAPSLFQRALSAAAVILSNPISGPGADPNLLRYPDGSTVHVVRDDKGAVTSLEERTPAGQTLAWRLGEDGQWLSGRSLTEAHRPAGNFSVQVGSDGTITTETGLERFVRRTDGSTTITNKGSGLEQRIGADGAVDTGRAGQPASYRFALNAGGDPDKVEDLGRKETWQREGGVWREQSSGKVWRGQAQIQGHKLVWTTAEKDGRRAIFVEDLRSGERVGLGVAAEDYRFLKDQQRGFIAAGLLPPAANITDADTLHGAAERVKYRLKMSELTIRRMQLNATSIGRRSDPDKELKYAQRFEDTIRTRLRLVDEHRYTILNGMVTIDLRPLDRAVAAYQQRKPTFGEITATAGEGVLLKVGDIFDGVVEHPFATAGLVVATIVAPEVVIPVLVAAGGFSAGYQIGVGGQTVYQGYQTNNHAQIYAGINKLSAGTVDLALTVAAARAPVKSAAAEAELQGALARNLSLPAEGLTRQVVVDALARRFPQGRGGVSLEEQILQQAADQLARMKGWDPVVVRLKTAPDLTPPAKPQSVAELAKGLGLPENATQGEALASLFKRYPRLRSAEALELTQQEAAAIRDLAELSRLKSWKTELVLKIEEAPLPAPGQAVLPGGALPALPAPRPSPEVVATLEKLGTQAADLKDAVGAQKLGFLSRESARQIGDGLKGEFLDAVGKKAADPANAGKSVHQLMQEVVTEGGSKYVLKGDPIPIAELEKQGTFSRVVGLESVFKYHLTDAALAQLKAQGITSAEGFAEAIVKQPALFNEGMLDKGSMISGRNGVAWWSPRGESKAGTLPELVNELALDPKYYKGGAIRISVDPEAASRLGFRKPTTFDGVPFKEWVDAPPGSRIGVTGGGKPEGVAPGIRLGDATQIEVFY